MRLAGALLFTAAGLLAGLEGSNGLRRRAEERAELTRMLALMEFELDRFATPLPALFERLAGQLEGGAGALCRRMCGELRALDGRTVAEIWAQALAPLAPAERRLLLPLGQVLGRYGAQEQRAALEVCRTGMSRAGDEARAAWRERGRVLVGLSAAGAAAVAVLLL